MLRGNVACPYRGGGYLHQERVNVYFRQGEDSDHGVHVTCTTGGIAADSSMGGNPSRRRDGIVIEFSCESCNERPRMAIVQNKGETQIKWIN